MEAQFDAFFMNVAQQCAQLSSSQHDVSAIDVMHEAYFGFLRRKTDFFSNNSNDEGNNGFESRGKKSVLTALQKQLEEVEKHKTQREKDEDEARRKRQKDLEKKRAKEEEMKAKRKAKQEEKKRTDRRTSWR